MNITPQPTNVQVKAKLCRNYLVGRCTNGDSCSYAHPQGLLYPSESMGTALFKPLACKTSPCKHFIRSQGWCPMGDKCDFIHDLDLSWKVKKTGQGETTRQKRDHHCWAYVQGLCRFENCPYSHPPNAEAYIKYTPCLQWPNCSKPACKFRHPDLNIPHSTKTSGNQSSSAWISRLAPPMPASLPPGPHLFVPTIHCPTATQPLAPLPRYSTPSNYPVPLSLNDYLDARPIVPMPYNGYEKNGTTWLANPHFQTFPPLRHEWTNSQWPLHTMSPPTPPNNHQHIPYDRVSSLELGSLDSFPSTRFDETNDSMQRVLQYGGLDRPDHSRMIFSEAKVAGQKPILSLNVDDYSFPFEAAKRDAISKPAAKSHNRRVSVSIKPVLPSDGLKRNHAAQMREDRDKRKSWSAFSFLDRNKV